MAAPTLDETVKLLETRHGKTAARTSSGLAYIVLAEGTGTTSPKPTDTVKVHYRGMLTDGTVFDSSYERRQPIEFGLNQVIPGWTEGVGLMKEGGKSILVIPAALGYGSRGVPGAIPGNAVLVFEVELLAIR